MPVTKEAEALLNECGINRTLHRLLIVDFLLAHPGHWSAEEIYEGLRQENQSLARATVYNSLKTLLEGHALKVLDLKQSEKRYEILQHRHAHSVCTECGRIRDISLPNDFAMQQNEMKNDGFQFADLQLTFYGICAECQKVTEEPSPTPAEA